MTIWSEAEEEEAEDRESGLDLGHDEVLLMLCPLTFLSFLKFLDVKW